MRFWRYAPLPSTIRKELIHKDMKHDGETGLAGWIRTTWLPYSQRVPEPRRDAFIQAVAGEYVRQHPLDAEGKAHVAMMLEVEATKVA